MQKPYDLAICMATYFNPYGKVPEGYREELYKKAIASINKCNFDGREVIFIQWDDGSDEPSDLVPDNTANLVIHAEHGEDWSVPLHGVIERGVENAEWTLWMDSDGELSPGGIVRAFDMVQRYPKWKAFGMFNSPVHELVERDPRYPGIAWKKSLTEHGTLFRSKDFKGWQGGWIHAMYGEGSTVKLPTVHPCLAPSGMQHNGRLGMNNPEGTDYDSEF